MSALALGMSFIQCSDFWKLLRLEKQMMNL